jgi:nucleotide-binding universal stress UspA family protein
MKTPDGTDVADRLGMDRLRNRANMNGVELLANLSSRILCWVCSSEHCDPAVALAQALARMHKGECHVVMSLDTPHVWQHSAERSIPLTPEIINDAKQKLAALYGDDVFTLVLPGDPITEIKRYARNKQMSLILVGEQGQAVERDYGQSLCEDAPCPVMTLLQHPQQAAGEASVDMPNLQRRGEYER